jgi:uncharacterized coiled-coil DUF342 family protein
MELTKEHFDEFKEFVISNLPTRVEISEEFAKLRSEVATKGGINELGKAVDKFMTESQRYHEEMEVLRYQVQTMRKWIEDAGKKIGLEYRA